ncbi:MAG: hypothetical protein PHQ75_14930 [Thermoguttaceae bacterium]|nr:hypothetical protein [Thermoguttaceae bacterium]
MVSCFGYLPFLLALCAVPGAQGSCHAELTEVFDARPRAIIARISTSARKTFVL